MTEIIQILAILIGGGGLGWAGNYLATRRKTSSDELGLLIATLREENQSLREREKETSAKIVMIERELNELRQMVLLLESAHQDLPIPMWLKDTKGTMLSLNDAYEDVFLRPIGKKKDDYIGRDDYDIWEKELADEYVKNDRQVLKSGHIFHGVEKVVFNDHETTFRVIKYPRFAGRIKIGIAGIAIPPEHEEIN